MNDKYDILIAAGQSNAAGTGVGETEFPYVPTENVMMLVDDSNPHFGHNSEGVWTILADLTAPMRIVTAEETPSEENGKCGQLQLAFAKAYYEKYLKDTDRKVLIIQAAVGGTGFARNEWGTEGAILFDRLIRMAQYALSLNSENRLTAFLWHQGECDTFENADWEPQKRYEVHKKNLTELFDTFCDRFDCPQLPMIAAGFTNEWYQKNAEPANAIYAAIKEVLTERNGAFLDTSDLKSNNEQTGNGDDIHFSRDALQKLGRMYFEKFVQLLCQPVNL